MTECRQAILPTEKKDRVTTFSNPALILFCNAEWLTGSSNKKWIIIRVVYYFLDSFFVLL